MPYSPLSLSEVQRRRALRVSSQLLVQTPPVSVAEFTENEEDVEEPA